MSNFYIGTQKPKSIYVGTSKVKALYLGTEKVWEVSGGGLPSEYQQCAFIRSDGSAYIATNFYGDAETEWYCAGTKMYNHNGDKMLFGVMNGVNAEIYAARRLYAVCGSTSGWSARPVGTASWDNAPFELTLTPSLATVNGVSSAPTSSTSVSYSLPIYVFCWNNNGSAQYISNVHEISTLVATKNGTKTLDLVPCYHKTSGEIGLYDLVGRQFYTNAGSGTFTKGADV